MQPMKPHAEMVARAVLASVRVGGVHEASVRAAWPGLQVRLLTAWRVSPCGLEMGGERHWWGRFDEAATRNPSRRTERVVSHRIGRGEELMLFHFLGKKIIEESNCGQWGVGMGAGGGGRASTQEKG